MDSQQLRTDYENSTAEYKMALRIVRTTLENLQELLEIKHHRTIFNGIKYRIKEYDSVIEKCNRKNYNNTPVGQSPEFDIKTILDHMLDIAGIRVITIYPDDVYLIYEAIKSELVITHEDDYIKNPKESGYSSLHLIASVQITSINGGKKNIPVEIQLRNVIMDAWATIDHESRYKNDYPDPNAITLLQSMAVNYRRDNAETEKIRSKKPAT